MVRDLNFDSPVRRGLDRQRLTSSPIDSCFDREWTARDLEIEDRIAGDGADLRAVDEDLVAPEPVCVCGAANTLSLEVAPVDIVDLLDRRAGLLSCGLRRRLWPRRLGGGALARGLRQDFFSWPSTAPQLKSAGIPTRRLRASCAFIATATRNSRWAGILARRRSGRRKRQPRSAASSAASFTAPSFRPSDCERTNAV